MITEFKVCCRTTYWNFKGKAQILKTLKLTTPTTSFTKKFGIVAN